MWHVIRYVAPTDWETTSLTQHLGHEVPILPLMKSETREKTYLPLDFYFFFPLFFPLFFHGSFPFFFLLPSSYFTRSIEEWSTYGKQNPVKLAIIRWLFRTDLVSKAINNHSNDSLRCSSCRSQLPPSRHPHRTLFSSLFILMRGWNEPVRKLASRR